MCRIRYCVSLPLVVLALFQVVWQPLPVQAQVGSTLPRDVYYLALRDYYAGSFRSAERGFLRSLNSGLRIGNRRWIDSICSYSMLGELYYRQGNFAGALQSHESALGIFLANSDWLQRLRYPQIGPSNDRIQTRIGWGTRPTAMGNFPDSMSSQEGSFDLTTSFQIGGAVNPAHMRSIDAVEVARCLAVSLRRRALLLGHSTSVSPLSSKLTQAVSRTNPPAGHWVNAWVEVLYGLAQLNEGLREESVAHLATGAVSGAFDHPLTGIALLEIGRFHMQKRDYAAAITNLHQASLAAARFRQPDIVEEALLMMTDVYLAGGSVGVVPALATVVPYAQREDFFRLTMAAQIASAELAYYGNQQPQAIALVRQASVMMTRTGLYPTELGARLNYVDALNNYRARNRAAAWKLLQAAIASRQIASLPLFHLATVEKLRAAGRSVIGSRELDILYSRMLREPSNQDWLLNPLDTMSWSLMDHSASMTNWFELLIDRKENEKAVAIAEQLKRHRFYQALPMGGRLLSLRWLFDGDAELLGKRYAKVQAKLRQKYPSMAQFARQSIRIRAELEQLPLLTEDDEQRVSQRRLYDELASVAQQQETFVQEIALRREPAPLVFPPQPSHSALLSALKPNQAMLKFVTTSKGWHVWFLRQNSEEYWPIRSPTLVRKQIQALVRGIGNLKANAALTEKDLAQDAWKQQGQGLWKSIVGKLPSNGWDGLEELVIIPDGPLWYLPFELLRVPADQLEDQEESQMLIDRVRIRYAPLASLALGDRIGHNDAADTTIVGGSLFPNETTDYVREMLSQWKDTNQELTVVGNNKPAAASNLVGPQLNRMVVWNELKLSSPFGWSPAQYDAKSNAGQLEDWMEYPWGGVDQIILPGMRTTAEALTSKGNGQEIFLAMCGLMSTGTRTCLLSRWRTGGRAPTILVREFVNEMQTQAASAAWQQATRVARNEQLHVDKEPRLRGGKSAEDVSADHPFFWAGYLLVDTGAEPEETPEAKEDDQEDQENAEVQVNQAADEEAANAEEVAGEAANAEKDKELQVDDNTDNEM